MDESNDEGVDGSAELYAHKCSVHQNGTLSAAAGAIACSDDGQSAETDGNVRSVVPKPSLPPTGNGSNASSKDSMPVDLDSHNNNSQSPYQHQQRRTSLSERRNFRSPILAPRDGQKTASGRSGPSEVMERHAGARKTSLPTVLPRPTELELTPAGTHGAVGSLLRGRMRFSESGHLQVEFEEKTLGKEKSVSESRLRKGSTSDVGEEAERYLQDTEMIVKTFIATAYQRDVEQIMGAVENEKESPVAADAPVASATIMTGIVLTPDLPPELQTAPLSPMAEIGRRLALLGDEFDQRYGAELDEMARLVLPHILGKTSGGNAGSGWSSTFEVFRNVARRLFEGSQITWGRIIALLSFGYRLVQAVLRVGLTAFVLKIINMVSRFIVVEPIANWVVRQGGWAQALFFQPTAENPRLQAVVEVVFWSVHVLAAALIVSSWLTRN